MPLPELLNEFKAVIMLIYLGDNMIYLITDFAAV